MPKKKDRKKPSKKRRGNQNTSIDRHLRQGKRLIPPMANIPNMQPMSWRDDRLPEMLWATLLVTHLDRSEALSIFRKLADYVHENQDVMGAGDITHTGLSKLNRDQISEILGVIANTNDQRNSLRSLLLIRDLPARQAWGEFLEFESQSEDWEDLMFAVAPTLNHQSQESTDCRWVRVLCMAAAGTLHLPDEEYAKEHLYYPEYGDMQKVRPFIRSTEGALSGLEESEGTNREWSEKFWRQCYTDTVCFPLANTSQEPSSAAGTSIARVREVYGLLVKHCNQTASSTSIDAKHDTVFGHALYCLSTVQELLRLGASQEITAQISLRTIVETSITLAYMTKKDDPELWKSYRVFGAGQAKLQYLKLEASDESTSFVNTDTLKALANEDMWEEFLPIELGHWNKSDLRSLSIEADVKDLYDKFYAWTSSFSHGHWGSVRDAVFTSCGNPLHRLHRIPRESARTLSDVIPDACTVIDEVLELVEKTYPGFPHRVALS